MDSLDSTLGTKHGSQDPKDSTEMKPIPEDTEHDTVNGRVHSKPPTGMDFLTIDDNKDSDNITPKGVTLKTQSGTGKV